MYLFHSFFLSFLFFPFYFFHVSDLTIQCKIINSYILLDRALARAARLARFVTIVHARRVLCAKREFLLLCLTPRLVLMSFISLNASCALSERLGWTFFYFFFFFFVFFHFLVIYSSIDCDFRWNFSFNIKCEELRIITYT